MEYRATDSGRRAAGAPGKTRYTDNGWRLDCGFGGYFDLAVGTPLESLRVDRFDRDAGVCGHRVHGRLRQDGATAQSRFDGQAKTVGPISDSAGCLVSSFHFDEIFLHALFME